MQQERDLTSDSVVRDLQTALAARTPGKWYAAEWSCRAITTVLVDDPTVGIVGKRVVAECDTEADARLIAMAPDLLEQCEKALAAWTGDGPAILLDDLRAVIRNATTE
jgi:hypothetical protein